MSLSTIISGHYSQEALSVVRRASSVATDDEQRTTDDADQLFHQEGLASPPADIADPFTLQWFLAVEQSRYCRRNEWIPHLLEFRKHCGETLLGLGAGLGTDWLQYARHGATVIACSTENANPYRLEACATLPLLRRNFELRGLKARFMHVKPTGLPIADASIDVVCMNGCLNEADDPSAVVQQIYRVLKPGGKVLAVVPSKWNMKSWARHFCIVNWRGKSASPTTIGFSRRNLKKLFSSFEIHRIHKRHIQRKQIPLPLRWLPSYCLHRLFGEFHIVKAFKPINATTVQSLAA